MVRSKRYKEFKIFAFLSFICGFFLSVSLFLWMNGTDPVFQFWSGALSVFFFLLNTWFYFKKIRAKASPEYVVKELDLQSRPKIVLIGGGTGLSTILRGIKNLASYDHQNISAIVTVADDGGSSGKLRKELDMIAPGDIRNCIVALSREETLLSRLFNFRFDSAGDLSGHSFGNLFLAALSQLNGGDFEKAVKTACDILAVEGKIIPASLYNVNIGARFQSGKTIIGESEIAKRDYNDIIEDIFLIPENAKANIEAVKAINEADAIIMGPGSLYTSIIPNLLFPQIREAIMRSKAVKVYVCNIMTQPGETDKYRASDHIEVLYKYIPGSIDYAIVNKSDMSSELLEKYMKDNSNPVELDIQRIKRMNVTPVIDKISLEGDYVRHDSDKLSRIILRLVEEYKKYK